MPSSQGPRTASLPAHTAQAQGAMPREAGEGRLGGLVGALTPWGAPWGMEPRGWDVSSGQTLPSTVGAAGRAACLGKKVLGGLQAQDSRVWGGGRQLAGTPLTPNFREQPSPAAGGELAAEVMRYPWACPQPKAEPWGGAGGTLGTS